eukprot:COSAG06_NODE_2139_length_7500_cov_3.787867_2_plen_146_part_00
MLASDGCDAFTVQDYGNAESNNLDTGAGSMEAIYFGNSNGWGHGSGEGPWIMADLENGLWAGNAKAMPQEPIVADYVTAMVKGKTDGFALKGGMSLPLSALSAVSTARTVTVTSTVTVTGTSRCAAARGVMLMWMMMMVPPMIRH